MSIKSSIEAFQEWDIRITRREEQFWTLIPSLKTWLYSTNIPEILSFTYSNKKNKREYISDSTILQQGSGCIAKTKETMLTR